MITNNKKYELTIVIIFFFTWGILFMDRLVISFIMPVIQPELGLTNSDVGMIGFVTTITYGISSVVIGILSDRIGYKKRILLPLIFGAGLFSGLGVVVTSFDQLLVVRALVGLCEGPVAPLLFSMLFYTNKDNFGRNCGILNASVGAIAITVGPVFVTQLVANYSWQFTFLLSSLPTFVMFVLVAIFVKETKLDDIAKTDKSERSLVKILAVFKYRNIILCCLICFFTLCAYWTLMLFNSLYLVNIVGMTVQNAGFVIASMGLLNILYSVVWPKLADIFGRKPILGIGLLLCMGGPIGLFLSQNMGGAYMYIAFGGMLSAVIPLFMTMIPMETVPVIYATTVGAFITGIGDLFGPSTITEADSWKGALVVTNARWKSILHPTTGK